MRVDVPRSVGLVLAGAVIDRHEDERRIRQNAVAILTRRHPELQDARWRVERRLRIDAGVSGSPRRHRCGTCASRIRARAPGGWLTRRVATQ